MSDFFEIAYAVASKRLCLFTGTGFSKSITKNKMPGWQQLLEELCDLAENGKELKNCLFPINDDNPLTLDESAQVISIALNKKSIHDETAKIISSVKLKGKYSSVEEFFSSRKVKVITTNYDKLIEELSGEKNCHSLAHGLPIPHYPARVEIYHVHGSVDLPQYMVLTSNNYFRFNKLSYFSSKLNTILYENTVVILGYSLTDTNLKTIINNYNSLSRNQAIGLNIFFISRSSIAQPIKDYYGHTYGIRVIDNLEVNEFFLSLNERIPEAEEIIKSSQKSILKVINNGKSFKKSYLKIENSFYEIISSIRAVGLGMNDKRVVKLLGDIIELKIELTGEKNAWEQYVHLANWLIYLASSLELKGTSIESIYLRAVLRSMTKMSEKLLLGYSWHAYKAWKKGWFRITASNRKMIKSYIQSNTTDLDALSVTR